MGKLGIFGEPNREEIMMTRGTFGGSIMRKGAIPPMGPQPQAMGAPPVPPPPPPPGVMMKCASIIETEKYCDRMPMNMGAPKMLFAKRTAPPVVVKE